MKKLYLIVIIVLIFAFTSSAFAIDFDKQWKTFFRPGRAPHSRRRRGVGADRSRFCSTRRPNRLHRDRLVGDSISIAGPLVLG